MAQEDDETAGFAEQWGQHMADSPFTAMGSRGRPDVSVHETVIMLAAEITSMQHYLLAMSVAMDNLLDTVRVQPNAASRISHLEHARRRHRHQY